MSTSVSSLSRVPMPRVCESSRTAEVKCVNACTPTPNSNRSVPRVGCAPAGVCGSPISTTVTSASVRPSLRLPEGARGRPAGHCAEMCITEASVVAPRLLRYGPLVLLPRRQSSRLACVGGGRDNGQLDRERCAAQRVVLGAYAPAVCGDDQAHQREAEPHPVRLRRVERVVEPCEDLRREAAACVRYARLDGRCIGRTRADVDAASTVRRVEHRLHAVQNQVQEDLLQLDTIPADGGYRIEGSFEPDAAADRLAPQELQRAPYDFVQIERLPLELAVLQELAQPADDCARAQG